MTLPNEAKAKPVSSLRAFFESKASQEIIESSQQEERTRTKIRTSFIPVRPIESDGTLSRSPSPFRSEKLSKQKDLQEVLEDTTLSIVGESNPSEDDQQREDLDDADSGYIDSRDVSNHLLQPTKSGGVEQGNQHHVSPKTAVPLKAPSVKNGKQTNKSPPKDSCVKPCSTSASHTKQHCPADNSTKRKQSFTRKAPVSALETTKTTDRKVTAVLPSKNVCKTRPTTSTSKESVKVKTVASRPKSSGNQASSSLLKPTAASIARTRVTGRE